MFHGRVQVYDLAGDHRPGHGVHVVGACSPTSHIPPDFGHGAHCLLLTDPSGSRPVLAHVLACRGSLGIAGPAIGLPHQLSGPEDRPEAFTGQCFDSSFAFSLSARGPSALLDRSSPRLILETRGISSQQFQTPVVLAGLLKTGCDLSGCGGVIHVCGQSGYLVFLPIQQELKMLPRGVHVQRELQAHLGRVRRCGVARRPVVHVRLPAYRGLSAVIKIHPDVSLASVISGSGLLHVALAGGPRERSQLSEPLVRLAPRWQIFLSDVYVLASGLVLSVSSGVGCLEVHSLVLHELLAGCTHCAHGRLGDDPVLVDHEPVSTPVHLRARDLDPVGFLSLVAACAPLHVVSQGEVDGGHILVHLP